MRYSNAFRCTKYAGGDAFCRTKYAGREGGAEGRRGGETVTHFTARSMQGWRAGGRAGASWRGAGVRIEMDEEGGREREVGCVSVMFML